MGEEYVVPQEYFLLIHFVIWFTGLILTFHHSQISHWLQGTGLCGGSMKVTRERFSRGSSWIHPHQNLRKSKRCQQDHYGKHDTLCQLKWHNETKKDCAEQHRYLQWQSFLTLGRLEHVHYMYCVHQGRHPSFSPKMRRGSNIHYL